MAIVKTIPSRRIINGMAINTSEISMVSELDYRTNGEECIIVKGIPFSVVILDSKNTDHVVIKSMTHLTIKPDVGKIDEDYDELIMKELDSAAVSWVVILTKSDKMSDEEITNIKEITNKIAE